MKLYRGIDGSGFNPARRIFLLATTLGLCLFAERARGQGREKIMRVGIVAFSAPGEPAPGRKWAGFDEELRERGWVEGRNIIFEVRYYHGDHSRLVGTMAELVALEVDVIVVWTAPAALAAKSATNRIPIIFSVGDALGRGVVSSLARPEGNATGVTSQYVELQAKRVELLKQVIPGMSRVAAFVNTEVGYPPGMFKDIVPSGVEIVLVDLRGPDELGTAMATIAKRRTDAVVVGQFWGGPQFRGEIVQAIARQRLPAIFPIREYVELGGLLSYGEGPAIFRQLAIYVDKILRGAKPTELPVERPMAYDLAINLKAAKTLGITIPRELIVRADWIVE